MGAAVGAGRGAAAVVAGVVSVAWGWVVKPSPAERLLEAKDVAELLAVPVSWVRQTTRAGHLPHVALGRYVRYDRVEVLRWVDEQRQGGGPNFRRHRPALASERGEA